MPATPNTRHAVSRLTGTTTFVRPVGGVWTIDCLTHKTSTTAPNRTTAWKSGSTPSLFCKACAGIASGKADKIAAGLLDVPAALAKKADAPGAKKTAPAKPAAKKATTTKPKETAAQRAARIKAEGFAKDKAATASGDAA